MACILPAKDKEDCTGVLVAVPAISGIERLEGLG